MLKKLTNGTKRHTTERFASHDLCTKSCVLRCGSDPVLSQSQMYFLSNWA